MPPDDESHLKEPFATLHRQRREQVPPFGMMRERALRSASAGTELRHVRGVTLRWAAFASTALVMLAAVAWRIGHEPAPAPRNTAAESASPQQVEQLLTAIEQHLELNDAIYSPTYPTDLLPTQTTTETTP